MRQGLTDTAIRAVRGVDKLTRLWDSQGLYLEITPQGGKRWRVKYYWQGKEARLSLGCYPQVSLKLARQRRDEIRAKVELGINPSLERKALKEAQVREADTVEVVAREWYLKRLDTISPSHAKSIKQRLERDVFPFIGSRPIAEVTAPELLEVLRMVEGRGALETAHREFNYLSQIWRYGVATGRCERDLTYDLRGALPPVKHTHFAAVTSPEQLGRYLAMFESYPGTVIVKAALRMAPHVFTRPGELRMARWADIDWVASEWRYLVTKTDSQHIVPLSRQVREILQELLAVTGRFEYLFTSIRNKNQPMSNMALNVALKSLGIPSDIMTAHGFRATARTLLDEVLGFRVDLIEHQLAHNVKDALGRAYNRTQFIKERHVLMQKWSDYLDQLQEKYALH